MIPEKVLVDEVIRSVPTVIAASFPDVVVAPPSSGEPSELVRAKSEATPVVVEVSRSR